MGNIVVLAIEEREEDGDDGSRENPVEGTNTITDESPGVEADKELCGSGKASSEDAAGANVGVGQEDGDEDEQAEQGVVHKGRLSDCSEESVDAMGESPGGGGEGPVGEVVGDDRTMAKEGGPGVGLVDGLVRHYMVLV